MYRRKMTPEEAMEIEIRHLREAAARFGGQIDRDRERRRAAAGRVREQVKSGAGYVSNHN